MLILDLLIAISILVLLAIIILPSIHSIGQTEVGLVSKRFGGKLPEDNPVALKGEAGYQADLLMPGWRWKFWVEYKVEKYPWVQVPAGKIGVVISQIGKPIPIGAKSAKYDRQFGNFTDLRNFVATGGQKGVQRPVLSPGTLAPIHPVGFLVITKDKVYGSPIDPNLTHKERLGPNSFGLNPEQLELVRIEPDAEGVDYVGLVTTYEGDPLEGGDIASRLGGFKDVEQIEKSEKGEPVQPGADEAAVESAIEKNVAIQQSTDAAIIDRLIGSKNYLHNNYQDFQKFLDEGGKIGLQYDPLMYGAYTLNPFLVSVEKVPMLMVKQGEVAVIKAYVGLVTKDVSGSEFKFGSIVRPGHRGIWQEPLRTGKYPINPRCYQAEIVPTSILTLNWAEAVSQAHNLDAALKQITAKSNEGFVFNIDLQVQIHVPDTKAPRVISMVGTMQNLVSEVLQAAVGNHFRDKLQSLPAVKFIETRQQIQEDAFEHISSKLSEYQVETKGVYIQDVILPPDLVKVLTEREIAHQRIETYNKQQAAENARIQMEKTKGEADMQTELAKSTVRVEITKNLADARKNEADGEAEYLQKVGTAKGAEVRAVGMARAEAYERQVRALGPMPTALVNAVTALAEKQLKFVPDVLVAGSGGSLDGLAGVLMNYLQSDKKLKGASPAEPPKNM